MLKVAKEFLIKVFQVPVGWQIWLLSVMAANMVAPLFFLNRIEAQVTIVAVIVSFVTGNLLYKQQGYTHLLGAMHWPWIFLVPYLWGRLDIISAGEPFGIWLRVVLVLNILSLILDAVEVIRYVTGDRQPIV